LIQDYIPIKARRSPVAARGDEAAALRNLTTSWRTLIEAHRGALV
jgi:hypothetical protein